MEEVPTVKKTWATHAQDAKTKEIAVLESELNHLLFKRDSGLGEQNIHQRITKMREKVMKCKQQLREKILRARRQQRFRRNQRRNLKKIQAKYPEAAKLLKVHDKPGHPSVVDTQPGLLQAICDLAIIGASADERRRSDVIRTCKTLDDTHERLLELGFELARSTLYNHLIPRNSRTAEGKRHVTVAPVKLCRAQNDLSREHQDQMFCKSTINALEAVASALTDKQVFFFLRTKIYIKYCIADPLSFFSRWRSCLRMTSLECRSESRRPKPRHPR